TVSPDNLLHTTFFVPFFDRPIDSLPEGYQRLTPELAAEYRQHVLEGIDGRPLRYIFKGINMGPDGGVFVEGHVVDETVFEARKHLALQYSDERRPTPMLHISLARVTSEITPQRFRNLYGFIGGLRDLDIGEITVKNVLLLEGFDKFGF